MRLNPKYVKVEVVPYLDDKEVREGMRSLRVYDTTADEFVGFLKNVIDWDEGVRDDEINKKRIMECLNENVGGKLKLWKVVDICEKVDFGYKKKGKYMERYCAELLGQLIKEKRVFTPDGKGYTVDDEGVLG